MSLLIALALRLARAPWWLRALPPVLCAVAIWMLSAQPGKEGPSPWWRSCAHNGAHVVAYGALGAFTWIALGAPERGRWAWVAVGLAGVYGVVDELHQWYVPRRAASVGDVVSDFAGACLCVGLARWWVRGDVAGRRAALWAVPLAVGAVAYESLG